MSWFLPVVTYVPLIVGSLEKLCTVFAAHRVKIFDVADHVWPGHDTEIEAAIGQVISACTTFQQLLVAIRGS